MTMSKRILDIGVIGIGFMGRTHIQAWTAAAAAGLGCRLAAVADRNVDRLRGDAADGGNLALDAKAGPLFDARTVATYDDPTALIDDPNVDVVSICTPTDTHIPLAEAALAAGKHVLVEKPVSLDPDAIVGLAERARAAGRFCMPAHCMRFWPGWDWLAERVKDGTLGRVRSATFQRLGTAPAWSREFYGDLERSGGALADLHIHDVDFIRHLFGDPSSLSSAGNALHVTTLYRFASGPDHVVAEGAWDLAEGSGFRMRYLVNFEQATADFDLTRTPPLLLCRNGKSEPIPLSTLGGYDGEVRHLLDVLHGRVDHLRVTLADAEAVARLLRSERRSLQAR